MKLPEMLIVGVILLAVVWLGNAGREPGAMTPLAELPDSNFWVVMSQSESGVDLLIGLAIVASFAWIVLGTKLGRGNALWGPVNDLVITAIAAGAIYLLYRF